MADPIISFSVNVGDLTRLSSISEPMAKFVRNQFIDGLEEAGMMLTGMVVPRTPVNYGFLRASIQWPKGYKFQRGKGLDGFRGVIGAGEIRSEGVSTSDYVIWVEEDTDPHWAPIKPLKMWAIRKFGDERIAYAIQRKIARSGTKGKHMFQRAWDEGGMAKTKTIFDAIPVKAVYELRRQASK